MNNAGLVGVERSSAGVVERDGNGQQGVAARAAGHSEVVAAVRSGCQALGDQPGCRRTLCRPTGGRPEFGKRGGVSAKLRHVLGLGRQQRSDLGNGGHFPGIHLYLVDLR